MSNKAGVCQFCQARRCRLVRFWHALYVPVPAADGGIASGGFAHSQCDEAVSTSTLNFTDQSKADQFAQG